MDCIFELKKTQIPQSKKIILGYAPHLLSPQSLFFSPIPLQNATQINYEVGTEEGVMLLLAHKLCTHPSSKLQKIFEEIDLGYLSAESNVGEEELEEIAEFLGDDNISILITQDFLTHPKGQNILSLFEEMALTPNIECFFDSFAPEVCTSLPEYNGIVVRITQGEPLLKGSQQFSLFAKLKDGDTPTISHQDFCIQAPFSLDSSLRGTIAILQLPMGFSSYPYQKVQIK